MQTRQHCCASMPSPAACCHLPASLQKGFAAGMTCLQGGSLATQQHPQASHLAAQAAAAFATPNPLNPAPLRPGQAGDRDPDAAAPPAHRGPARGERLAREDLHGHGACPGRGAVRPHRGQGAPPGALLSLLSSAVAIRGHQMHVKGKGGPTTSTGHSFEATSWQTGPSWCAAPLPAAVGPARSGARGRAGRAVPRPRPRLCPQGLSVSPLHHAWWPPGRALLSAAPAASPDQDSTTRLAGQLLLAGWVQHPGLAMAGSLCLHEHASPGHRPRPAEAPEDRARKLFQRPRDGMAYCLHLSRPAACQLEGHS